MALRNWRSNRRLGSALAACSLVLVAMSTYAFVRSRHLDELHRTLASRAEVYGSTIGGVIDRYEFLPLAVAQSDLVKALLAQRGDVSAAEVNTYLERINRRSGAFAVYVIGLDGTTLASSNWKESTSYVGQNYGFRPYFKLAAGGDIGRYYGIGVSTGEAGYFISQAVWWHERVIGVAVAKVSLDWLERSWRSHGDSEQILVKDGNGVILLSSIAAFKFKLQAPLSAAAQRSIREQRQFQGEDLALLPHAVRERFADGASVISLGNHADYLAVSHRLAPLEWDITVLAELDQVQAAARNAAVAAALGWALLMLGALYAGQRRSRIRDRLNAQQALGRAYAELEVKVAQRTADLQNANLRLQAEVSERERAERTLRQAQSELVQSGKLAAIGQMAAGVTHELNQPLAALQTFSDNTRVLLARGRIDDALDNLSTIADLVKRLGYITSQLKGFARRSDDSNQSASVRTAFAQTLLQIRTRRGAERLVLSEDWPEEDLIVPCNPIRLEQVFSNLLSNAMEAVPAPGGVRIAVVARQEGDRVRIEVTDNGPGVPAASLDRIFEPFYTTKEQGLGLGLSISAGIIRAAGGTLAVRNRSADEGGGAQFIISFTCQKESHA
ncbi:two-component sensor [Massilia sp. WF1]|nr:two-component sensor [Massilia sp. WG5]KLU38440.1 two-component sensor [Massilia sp. WF1]